MSAITNKRQTGSQSNPGTDYVVHDVNDSTGLWRARDENGNETDYADDAGVVHIAGTETVTGTKTFTNLIIGDSTVQLDDFSDLTFQRSTTGKTRLLVTSNGDNDADLILTRGNDSNATITLTAKSGGSAQLGFGTSYDYFIINPDKNDCDTVIKGDTDDYLLVADAGLDVVVIGGVAVASAKLAITSTDKGFLPPRMTSVQRNAISSPAEGLIVYDTTTTSLQFYNGTGWMNLSGSGS